VILALPYGCLLLISSLLEVRYLWNAAATAFDLLGRIPSPACGSSLIEEARMRLLDHISAWLFYLLVTMV
jgi:hypothetical protein